MFSILSYVSLEVLPVLNGYFETGSWTPADTRAVFKAVLYSCVTLLARYSAEKPVHTPEGVPGRDPIIVPVGNLEP